MASHFAAIRFKWIKLNKAVRKRGRRKIFATNERANSNNIGMGRANKQATNVAIESKDTTEPPDNRSDETTHVTGAYCSKPITLQPC